MQWRWHVHEATETFHRWMSSSQTSHGINKSLVDIKRVLNFLWWCVKGIHPSTCLATYTRMRCTAFSFTWVILQNKTTWWTTFIANHLQKNNTQHLHINKSIPCYGSFNWGSISRTWIANIASGSRNIWRQITWTSMNLFPWNFLWIYEHMKKTETDVNNAK